MRQLLSFVFTIVRIALIFLLTYAVTSFVFFRHFYNGKNDQLVILINMAAAFLITLAWYRWKEKKEEGS